jgi:hypothetical protein
MKEYSIKPSPFDRERKLILTEDYLEWENRDLKGNEFTRLDKSDIIDFKHGMEWIVWYRFTVGRKFSISIRAKNGKELKIQFYSYFNLKPENNQTYSKIVNDIWTFYHSDVVKEFVNTFFETGEAQITGFKFNREGLELREGKGLIPWDMVATKEYYNYFAVYHRENNAMHSRVSYNS